MLLKIVQQLVYISKPRPKASFFDCIQLSIISTSLHFTGSRKFLTISNQFIVIMALISFSNATGLLKNLMFGFISRCREVSPFFVVMHTQSVEFRSKSIENPHQLVAANIAGSDVSRTLFPCFRDLRCRSRSKTKHDIFGPLSIAEKSIWFFGPSLQAQMFSTFARFEI